LRAFKDRVPFEPQRLEEERAKDKRVIITVSLSLEEYSWLKDDMKVLRQLKDSTALKQGWKIGRNVIHDNKTGLALRTVLGNTVRNEKIGVSVYEPDYLPNVTQKRGDV